MSRMEIYKALHQDGYVMLQFAERHRIPLRSIWRMREYRPRHPPRPSTLRRFSDAIRKDRAAGIAK